MKIRILLSCSVIALVVFGLLFSKNISNLILSINSEALAETQSQVQTNTLNTVQSVSLPVFISIPSINVNAPIEKVGLTSDGKMGIPKYFLNTGWYEHGPRPGEIGSAVIDGHVDWIKGAAAVFKNLHKMKIGDKIVVQDDKGMTIHFVVRKISQYNAKDDATNIFISNDGKAHLNIITCTGTWNKKINQYSKRLVIFADKE